MKYLAIISALLSIGAAPPPSFLVRHALTGQAATALAERAVALCAKRGFDVGAAVVDAAAEPRALVTADRVSALSVDMALRKARAAAINGYETSKLAAATMAAPAYAAALRTVHPDMLFLGGGVPIRIEGELVGALGVGGGNGPEADEACAADALVATPALAPAKP
jgi:uncharacterized protein GlcG (DUF336 family)